MVTHPIPDLLGHGDPQARQHGGDWYEMGESVSQGGEQGSDGWGEQEESGDEQGDEDEESEVDGVVEVEYLQGGEGDGGGGVVGTGVTALGVIGEIQSGVPADKAITKGSAQTTAGALVGAGFAGLASAGYIGATVATGGTLVVGTVAVAGVGYLVDKFWYHR